MNRIADHPRFTGETDELEDIFGLRNSAAIVLRYRKWVMSNLKADLDRALAQLRSSEGQLSRTIAELEAADLWSGDDAKKFQSDWSDQVRRPLMVAAGMLEGFDFSPVS